MEVADCAGYLYYAWNELLLYDFILSICEVLFDKKNYEVRGIEADRKIIQESYESKEILAFLREPTKVHYSDLNFCFQEFYFSTPFFGGNIFFFSKGFKLNLCLENGSTHLSQDF